MTSRSILASLLALATCAVNTTYAQVIVWKKGQQSISDSIHMSQQQEFRNAWEAPKQITLTPAVESSPALKHRFWVSPIERSPGDVRSHVDRVIMMYLQNPRRKELDEEYYEISSMFPDVRTTGFKLNDELKQRIREYLASQADVLKQLHYALSLDTVRSDYALRDMRGQDFFAYNLADVQNLRALARLLQLECQLAVGDGRYDDAVSALSDGYRVAELALRSGEGTIVCQLVSIAIVGIMNAEVELMASQAGSPNLYWALAALPTEKLFSIRSAFEGESIGAIHTLFPWGTNDSSDITDSQAESRLIELIELAQTSVSPATEETTATAQAQRRAIAALVIVLFADKARIELQHKELGNSQAILQWTQGEFTRLRDEIFKWMLLPVQERMDNESRLSESQRGLGGIPASPGQALVGLVLPAIQAADAAVQRVQRQHAFLVTLEALRAYAAENAGEMPMSLADLRPLPAWSDPTTGEPFSYRRIDARHAVLIIEKSMGVPHEFHLEIGR